MKKARLWLASAVLLGILVQPEAAVHGAQRAMRIWCTGVAPSLFPFLALMPVLTGQEACAAYNSLLSGAMRRLFHLPGAAAPAVAIGLIAGSPGGAIGVCRIARNGGLRATDARRIALAITGVSPAYLILGVGLGLYGSAKLGLMLACIQLVVQLTLLCLLRGILPQHDDQLPTIIGGQRPADGMRAAVESILVICGYMVVFGAIVSVAASWIGNIGGMSLLLALDLPSGLAELAACNFPGKMLIQGVAVGFGGLCIAAQNLDALRGIGVRPGEYFAVRGVAAGLFGCISGVLLRAQEANYTFAVEKTGLVYAFSLAIACIFAVPGLVFLTKNLFLNKNG